MHSEIGSNFWLNPHENLRDLPLGTPSQFGCEGSDYVWLSTGRSAIRFVVQAIEKDHPDVRKTVVLPPFTCHTVIEPFIEAGYETHYYEVDEKLGTTAERILQCVDIHHPSMILFHRYYGFDTIQDVNELCNELRDKGVFTIEDCTQCLYSIFPRSNADFFVGSIRKWVGTPDGGFAVCREGAFMGKPTETDVELETAKTKASFAKYRFLFEHQGDKASFLQQYREAEDILASRTVFYTVSAFSASVQSNLDVQFLKKRRRQNYKTLLQELLFSSEIQPLFSQMDNDAVPLYLPVFVKDRSSLQAQLAQHAIFAPVVWPKADCLGSVCDEAESLYQHLLCIPIDQRYDEEDMLRIAKTINNFF